MKATKNTRPVIVGIFIALGLVIFLVGVFTLGGQKKAFSRNITVIAEFNDVSGLQAGSNVWLSGVKIGTVQKVSLFSNGRVQVTMHIQKNQAGFIHKDALVQIGSDGLIGNKLVEIYGGTQAAGDIADGDHLQVSHALSTEDILTTLQQNNKNLLEITNNFKAISKKIHDGEGSIGALLNDSSMVVSLRATLLNFRKASLTANTVVNNLAGYTQQFNNKGTLAHELVADTNTYNVLRNTVTQLRDAASNADDFTNNLYYISETMKQPNNTLSVLLRDSAAARDLRATIMNLRTSSEKLDEDLEAVQHNFLLRGFFKRKQKENKDKIKTGQ